MSTANAELRRPTGIGCSDLLDHKIVITQSCFCRKRRNAGNVQSHGANGKSHAFNPCESPISALYRKPNPAGINRHRLIQASVRIADERDVVLVISVSCGLTSRAQARGADDVLRDSGTGTAIPRCLQRFVSPLVCVSVHKVLQV